jgi:hypothetical protein
MDGRVLLFTIVVSVCTGILFGILPAFAASRVDLVSAFKDSGTASEGGWKANRAQSVLVVAEIVLALVLLVGAGLLIKTFVALREVDRGFDPRNVLTLDMSLSGTAGSAVADGSPAFPGCHAWPSVRGPVCAAVCD